MGTVIVTTSGKGGTGKSLFTANLGAMLAMKGKRVVMLDMDMGLRNLDLYLGLESRVVYNVMDVLSGMCRIKQALIRDKRFDYLYLIAASPSKDERDITKLHMEVLCDKLKEAFDYILIDAPAGIGDGFELSVAAADKAVVVTEGEVASVRDADTVDRELERLGIEDRCCVINKVKADLISLGILPGIATISKELRMEIAGIIQYDDNIYISASRGVPIVLKEDTYITRNFEKILSRVLRRGGAK